MKERDHYTTIVRSKAAQIVLEYPNGQAAKLMASIIPLIPDHLVSLLAAPNRLGVGASTESQTTS
jgi:hypothetical protein